MENAITLKGDLDRPVVSEEVMLIQFYSGENRQGKPAFAMQPVYFSVDIW